jgi:hypothetical protein
MRTKALWMRTRLRSALALGGEQWRGNKTIPRNSGLWWGLLVAVMLTAGCSKHQATSAANPATNAADPSASADASPAPPSHGPGTAVAPAIAAVVPDAGDVKATLEALSLELRKYVVRTRSVPKTFEEFAAKSHLQAPPAPPGKKYAIQNQGVTLVKR